MSLREDLLELVRDLDEIEGLRHECARLRALVGARDDEVAALTLQLNKAVVRMLNAEIELAKSKEAA